MTPILRLGHSCNCVGSVMLTGIPFVFSFCCLSWLSNCLYRPWGRLQYLAIFVQRVCSVMFTGIPFCLFLSLSWLVNSPRLFDLPEFQKLTLCLCLECLGSLQSSSCLRSHVCFFFAIALYSLPCFCVRFVYIPLGTCSQ